jgi:pSer/pThr/pTyr-binding forkhead associated (FHA) protein
MRLKFIHPAIGEIVFPVQLDSRIVVGRRGGGSGIELNWDKRISRKHAALRITAAGEIFFMDLGSNNGSFYGDQRIEEEIRFERGMSILIGETVMLVSDDEEELDDPFGAESTDKPLETQDLDPEFQPGDQSFEIADMRTAEMRSPEADVPILDPIPAPEQIPATTARFVDFGKVEAFFADREAFGIFWRNELSQTGLFVATDRPPHFGCRVDVHIATPDGAIDLTTSVVHVVDQSAARRFRMSPGVGLQVNDLGLELRERLERYARGELSTLSLHTGDVLADADSVLDRAREILTAYDAGRYYEALQIAPDSQPEALAARIQEVESYLTRPDGLTGPTRARIDAALTVLGKMSAVLGVQQRRLQYDFRSGHVRVGERLKHAYEGTGPSIAELRRAWNLVHPDRVDRSAVLMRQAFAASHQRDLDTAIRYGTEALELNPFFEQLRTYLSQWKAAQGL